MNSRKIPFARNKLALAITLLPALATAQNQLTLEEVIVTAQKRAESVQDVAATVNALSGDAIDQYSIQSFEEVANLSPGVDLAAADARRQTITIRGVTTDPDNFAEAPISTYWNGIPIRSKIAFGSLMYDVKRVEILRGPQGTLQGRTDPSGAIIIHSREPDLESGDGYVQQTFSDNSGSRTEVAVGFPIIEGVLGVRVAGLYDENDGQGYKNINNGQEQKNRTQSGRLSVKWVPTDTLDLDLAYNYKEGKVIQPEAIEGDIGGFANLQTSIWNTPVKTDPDYPNEIDMEDRHSITGGQVGNPPGDEVVALSLNWDLGPGTLTYLGGYSENEEDNILDRDWTYSLPKPQAQATTTKVYNRTHELRFTSNESFLGWWDWMFGFFAEDRRGHTVNVVDASGSFQIYGDLLPVPDWQNLAYIQTIDIPTHRKNKAVFTHNTFHISEAWKVQLGLRYQDSEVFARADGYVENEFPFGPTDGSYTCLIPDGSDCNQTREDLTEAQKEALTGTLKLQWYMNDSTMLYAGYDRSFRPPGAFITPEPLEAENLVFGHETSDALEIGFKTELAGGQARLNGAIFYQSYDGYQARAVQPLITLYNEDGSVSQRKIMSGGPTFNADATVQGAEVEFQALLAESWTLNGGVAYTDASFDDGEQGPCADPLTPEEEAQRMNWSTCDIGGDRVSTLPLWSANLSSEYAVAMEDREWYIRGLYKWGSEREDRLVQDETIPSYGILNLWTGIRSADGTWDLNVWVKNVTDEIEKTQPYPKLILNIGPINEQSNWRRSTTIAPRTVGATLRYNFDL